MAILEPQDLKSTLTPTIYFGWIIGMGVFQQTRSKRIRVLMILYSVGFWICYVVAFYTSIRVMVPLYLHDISPMAIVMYQVLVYTNTCASLAVPLLAWKRRKGINDCIKRIQKLDDTVARILGFEKNYKKILLEQIYQILVICLMILTITITDSLWLRSDTLMFINCAIMFTFHQPILLMLVTHLIFCGAVRCLRKKFRDMNTALLGLAELNVASYPRGKLIAVERKISKASSFHGVGTGEAEDIANARYLFQTIRKTHLELCKVAGKINVLFGIQNLISMAVSCVMITGLLYTIYTAFYWKHSTSETIREVLPPACWCIIYIFKIIMISYACASTSEEAQKSGQIIFEILGSAFNKEFQKEIQEFSLQMIQNPVRFTACGFFTLDCTYVQGVIGSITTYLVILIQMSDAPSSTSTSTANTTIV